MYDMLDNYLKEFENDKDINDFWYDIGTVTATKIIKNLKQQDWDYLLNRLSQKTSGWKKRFAYCLDEGNNSNEFKALLIMMEVDDEQLFEICIDSIRSHINIDNVIKLFENRIVFNKAKKLIEKREEVSLVMLKELFTTIKECIINNSEYLDNSIKYQMNKDLAEIDTCLNMYI